MKKCTECEMDFEDPRLFLYHVVHHLTDSDVESVLKFIWDMIN